MAFLADGTVNAAAAPTAATAATPIAIPPATGNFFFPEEIIIFSVFPINYLPFNRAKTAVTRKKPSIYIELYYFIPTLSTNRNYV